MGLFEWLSETGQFIFKKDFKTVLEQCQNNSSCKNSGFDYKKKNIISIFLNEIKFTH